MGEKATPRWRRVKAVGPPAVGPVPIYTQTVLSLPPTNAAPVLRLSIAAVLASVLIAHSLLYGFVTDDAYVAFVYARNLAETGQLVFNPGLPPVEGFTSFLWTILLAGLSRLGFPLATTALVLGAVFSLATLIVMVRLTRPWVGGAWATFCAVLLATSAGYACWTSGGLETSLFVFLCLLCIASYCAQPEARFGRLGLLLAACAMTRPEGLLLVAVLGCHRVVSNAIGCRRRLLGREELIGLGCFLGVWLPWFLWRAHYFGHWLPNTYYAKASGPASAEYQANIASAGVHYLERWLADSGLCFALPVVIVGLVAWGRGRAQRRFAEVTALFSGSYLLYVAKIGGDFMGLHRFVMPISALAVVAFVLGLHRIASSLPSGRRRTTATGIVIAVATLGHIAHQGRLTLRSRPGWRGCAEQDAACIEDRGRRFWSSDRGIDTPSYLAVYAHDREVIGRHLAACLRPDDFSIFGGVGAKPFFSRGRGVDVFGLVSEEIAHQVPRTNARPGHNKWGPDALLFQAYRPQFLFSCYSLHRDADKPSFNCNPDFWRGRDYRSVTLHIPGLIERGTYYSFWVSPDRYPSFVAHCPGVRL